MLFTQLFFIFCFLPVFILGFFSSHRFRFTTIVIFLSSLCFHGAYSKRATLLLICSILFNFLMLKRIHKNKKILVFSIFINLAVLFYFKYFMFFSQILNDTFALNFEPQNIILPLGISFFTFTQIACLVDTYHTELKNKTFLNYAAFISFFPHIIAGPIIHFQPIVQQFMDKRNHNFNMENFLQGLRLFVFGLGKKLIIADTIASCVDPIFQAVSGNSEIQSIEAWTIALGYTFQLYFDFSGYSDMASGISKMININLPINFNTPYLSTNLIDFWKRWHITLSSFLKNYLYIPLGGSRKGLSNKYINLLTTMLLGGLWHGAGYTYLLWGIYHGIGLVINHLIRDFKILGNMPTILKWLVTFLFIVNGWVIFRSPDLNSAFMILKSMYFIRFDATSNTYINFFGMVFLTLFYITFSFFSQKKRDLNSTGRPEAILYGINPKSLFFIGILFSIAIMMTTNESPFLYFQF